MFLGPKICISSIFPSHSQPLFACPLSSIAVPSTQLCAFYILANPQVEQMVSSPFSDPPLLPPFRILLQFPPAPLFLILSSFQRLQVQAFYELHWPRHSESPWMDFVGILDASRDGVEEVRVYDSFRDILKALRSQMILAHIEG